MSEKDYITVTAWISTNKVGSECTVDVEIPLEDLEDLNDADRDAVVEEYCRDAVHELTEWGWRDER